VETGNEEARKVQDLKVLNARGFTAEIRGEGVHPIKVVVGVHREEQWEAKEKEATRADARW